jgi:formate/nitrite transporter FocA (FNT family)
MFFIPAGIFASGNFDYYNLFTAAHGISGLDMLTWGGMIVRNLIPATLGNIVGGMALVGMTYWFVYLRDTEKKEPLKTGSKKKK